MLDFSSLIGSFNKSPDRDSELLPLDNSTPDEQLTHIDSPVDKKEPKQDDDPTIIVKSENKVQYINKSKKQQDFVFETKQLSETDFCELIKEFNREEILKTIEINNISEPLLSSFCLEDLREVVIDLWRAKLLVREERSFIPASTSIAKFLSDLGPVNIYFKYIL